ncbi:integrase, catalytic region, zinc finger, CCHC-type containing protein [Tanacetum coccineum]
MQRCLFSKRTLRGRSLCFVLEMIIQVTPPDTCSVLAPSGGVTKPKLGEKFPTVNKFKECLTFCALANGLHCILKEVVSLIDDHCCVRNFNYGRLISYKWLGRHFGDKIRMNPQITLDQIARLVKKKYKCIVSRTQCRNAKNLALNEGEVTIQDHYGYLRSYAKALKDGWKIACRRIIALDGCFLKKQNCGKILIAVGRDGNNHIFLIAWVVMSVENKYKWTWFLELIAEDLEVPNGAGLTLMSDQHKGLIEAVKDVMPLAEHRQCACHIYDGFRKQFSGVQFRELFMDASKATYPQRFNKIIEKIKIAIAHYGLPEDIYVAIDSCETAQEIWLRVQQMMKGSDIGIQEKKAKLFNECERFTSTDWESIKSYYHRFSKLMNDFKINKHFSEKIASNLKFLNNLQPEWIRHVTIIHQTKDLHIADYTQLCDFLKYNKKEVDDLRAERLAKTHDPLALMANSNNPFNYLVFHQDQPSTSTYMQQLLPNNNNYNPQPSFNQNYMQQPIPNLEDITDPTTAMNMALVLMAKAFKLNYSTPTNNNQRISSNPQNRQIAQPVQNVRNQVIQNAVQNPGVQNVRNQNGLIVVSRIANQNPNRNGNVVAARAEGNAIGNNGNQIRCYNYRGLAHLARNCTVKPRRRDVAYLQTQLLIAQKEEARIQLQAEEFDLIDAAADLDEIEEVNANCILMANL